MERFTYDFPSQQGNPANKLLIVVVSHTNMGSSMEITLVEFNFSQHMQGTWSSRPRSDVLLNIIASLSLWRSRINS